jgi:hypothetical protein
MSIEFPQLPNPFESGFVDAPRRLASESSHPYVFDRAPKAKGE